MGIQRKTPQVQAIVQLFNQTTEAISAIDLVAQFKEQMNKTTVYRILDRLEQDGIIHTFNDINGLRWYAKCSNCSSNYHADAHPHFQCTDCGTVECLPIEVAIPKVGNHYVDSASIMLVGTCEKCLS